MATQTLTANTTYTFAPTPDNKCLFEIGGASLVISPSTDTSIRVECAVLSGNSADYRCTADTNGRFSVVGKRVSSSSGNLRVEIRADIPDSCVLDLQTRGGSIKVGKHKAAINGDAGGGSIKIDEAGGPSTLHVSGGSIDVGVMSGSSLARASGGSIKFGTVSGPVDASVSGGSINATLTGKPDAMMKASAGSITLAVEANAAFTLLAAAVAGTVTVSPPLVPQTVTTSHFAGPINGGGSTTVDLGASAGSIVVRAI